jgi:hypothetical protein
MILEIMMWGFFSAIGWMGANYMKDQIWPPEPTPVVIVQDEDKKAKTIIDKSK